MTQIEEQLNEIQAERNRKRNLRKNMRRALAKRVAAYRKADSCKPSEKQIAKKRREAKKAARQFAVTR